MRFYERFCSFRALSIIVKCTSRHLFAYGGLRKRLHVWLRWSIELTTLDDARGSRPIVGEFTCFCARTGMARDVYIELQIV